MGVEVRFCDAVDITDQNTWRTSSRWPVSPLSTPSVMNGYLVQRIGPALRDLDATRMPDFGRDAVDETGFYPSTLDVSPAEAWLALLDSHEQPSWAKGERRVRVFLPSEEEASQGFIPGGGHGAALLPWRARKS